MLGSDAGDSRAFTEVPLVLFSSSCHVLLLALSQASAEHAALCGGSTLCFEVPLECSGVPRICSLAARKRNLIPVDRLVNDAAGLKASFLRWAACWGQYITALMLSSTVQVVLEQFLQRRKCSKLLTVKIS